MGPISSILIVRKTRFGGGIDCNCACVPPWAFLRAQILHRLVTFKIFQEAKLRNRVQGLNESMTAYYYDVVNLCRSVDPNMPENYKIEALFRGLKPSLSALIRSQILWKKKKKIHRGRTVIPSKDVVGHRRKRKMKSHEEQNRGALRTESQNATHVTKLTTLHETVF